MAFIFPDDKATFTAPNGITYAWKTDHWVVQKFKGDHEVYVSPTPPDDPQEGKLWYDSSSSVIELFIYVDGAWVSATPSSEYALESRIAANEQGIRDLWSDQQRQDWEIAGIANRVDALEGVVGEYTYTFQTANQQPREGQLSMLKADMSTTTRWEEAASLMFNPTTLSGDTFDQSEIVTGDVIRLHVQGDITMQVSAFEVKVIQNNNGLLQIDQKIKSVGTGMDGATYEVFHLSSFDPSGLATMDYVDAQDELLLPKSGGAMSGELVSKTGTSATNAFSIKNQNDSNTAFKIWCPGGSGTEVKYVGRNGTAQYFQSYDSSNVEVLTTAKFEYESYNFAAQADVTYGASDAHYFKGNIRADGTITFARGTDKLNQFKISPNGSTDYATNIYSLNGGQMRFRTSHTNQEKDNVGSHIILDSAGGVPETKIYNVVTPTNDRMAANKAYVDAQAGGGGVPIGTIVMWLGTYAPDGWLICDGSSFDTTEYAALHTHLQTIYNYADGKTPDFKGLYPGGAGSAHNNNLTSGGATRPNVYHSQRTAMPSGGPPHTVNQIPDGSVRTFTATGNTNAYSNGVARPSISENWDTVTRPPTLSVHFIIKAA